VKPPGRAVQKEAALIEPSALQSGTIMISTRERP
jgi:hypothetical protein